jgi:murein DD-endopeptidase MepM/ murein hydrolase activator NlpD
VLLFSTSAPAQWFLPINAPSRTSCAGIQLTQIGAFGLVRKARIGIPAHLHTGIDIKRPHNNYVSEPIYPAADGTIISLRDDGPFAQIIIEHDIFRGTRYWTVYEHIAGIQCTLGQRVSCQNAIARFFSLRELNKYGWQFDHVHFEIMKEAPISIKPQPHLPYLRYKTYALTCYSRTTLDKRMINPIPFLESVFAQRNTHYDNDRSVSFMMGSHRN